VGSFSINDALTLAQLLPQVLEELRSIAGDIKQSHGGGGKGDDSLKPFLASISDDIEKIKGAVYATAQKVTDMALDLTQLKTAAGNIAGAITKSEVALRDLATRQGNPQDQADVNAVADGLNAAATELNALVDQVDPAPAPAPGN